MQAEPSSSSASPSAISRPRRTGAVISVSSSTSPCRWESGITASAPWAGWKNLSGRLDVSLRPLQLTVGETVGCEFHVFDSPLVDIAATITSRIGKDLYGARFQAGPMSQHLIEDSINAAIEWMARPRS